MNWFDLYYILLLQMCRYCAFIVKTVRPETSSTVKSWARKRCVYSDIVIRVSYSQDRNTYRKVNYNTDNNFARRVICYRRFKSSCMIAVTLSCRHDPLHLCLREHLVLSTFTGIIDKIESNKKTTTNRNVTMLQYVIIQFRANSGIRQHVVVALVVGV